MAKRWTLTVRNGSSVERSHFESHGASVDAMEQRLLKLADEVGRETISVLTRRFDPSRQVVVRGEISAPGGMWSAVHGGVDLRGDGSAEAYTGRLRRSLVELQRGESPYDGLRRVLGEMVAG